MTIATSVKATEFYPHAVEIEEGLKHMERALESENYSSDLDWTIEKMDVAIAQARALNGIARCLALLVAQKELAP